MLPTLPLSLTIICLISIFGQMLPMIGGMPSTSTTTMSSRTMGETSTFMTIEMRRTTPTPFSRGSTKTTMTPSSAEPKTTNTSWHRRSTADTAGTTMAERISTASTGATGMETSTSDQPIIFKPLLIKTNSSLNVPDIFSRPIDPAHRELLDECVELFNEYQQQSGGGQIGPEMANKIKEFAGRLFEAADANKDGILSFKEGVDYVVHILLPYGVELLMNPHLPDLELQINANVAEAILKGDADGDGALSKAEAMAVIGQMPIMPTRQPKFFSNLLTLAKKNEAE